MKKILLFVLGLVVYSSASSQNIDTLVYQTITDFRLDTVSFLRYNFIERADIYRGESFSKLYEDLDIKPLMMGVGYSFDEEGKRLFSGIRLYLGKHDNINRYIQISWEEPMPMMREVELLMRKHGSHKWLERYAVLFGNNKIAYIYTDESINSVYY